MSEVTLEKVVSLAKRRGFAFQSSEIYGGMANAWDFGPVGTLLKNNIRDSWWNFFVLEPEDMVGIDASIFLSPKVWEASGHVESFTDTMVDCRNCKFRTRADHLIEDYFEKKAKKDRTDAKKIEKVEGHSVDKLTGIIKDHKDLLCPKCGLYAWTDVKMFNLLFETSIGIIEGDKSKAYLRGEIAQGIFVNFKNVLDSTRIQIPFGIAQVGKAFRNEITMGQFLHRTLEFDLMEFEYFVKPDEWRDALDYFKDKMMQWSRMIGLKDESLRWREHEDFERSHYSSKTADIEYKYPFGWKEMFGIAHRTDYDLRNHMENSGKDLSYIDPQTHEKYIPHVIEPTFGLSRLIAVVLFDAYTEEESEGRKRIVLKLDPKIAPYKVAVFPLLANKEELVHMAKEVHDRMRKSFVTTYDGRGNIGKRYLAQDEIGTPFCVTVDFDTLVDNSVTVRDRDTASQERVKIESLSSYLTEKIG